MKPQPLNPRWRRRKDARPSEIVEAALDSFVERGFAATRLDDIAKRAGVTKGTLYLYFDSKEELFKAVVRQSVVPILAGAERAVAASQAPTPELLGQFISSFADNVIGSRVSGIPKLVLAEAANFPDLARFYRSEVIERGMRLVRGLIQRGIDRGEFRRVELEHVFFCVIAPLLIAMLWRHSLGRADKTSLDAHALCRTHVDLLLRGLQRDRSVA